MRRFLVHLKALFVILCLAAFCLGADYGKVTGQKVADAIYLFTTTPYGDVGMSGNSVAIVTSEAVLIFDTTGTPGSAAQILSEIKKLTRKPVRFVVNSHWHWDHWGGNEAFLTAFPHAEIITHEKTLELMKIVEPRWNHAGLTTQLPAYLADFEKRVQSARANHAPADELKSMEELLHADRDFLKQKSTLHKTLPSVTFSDSMSVRPAGMEIQIRHARAITPGDTYLWLPAQKILITGDIMLDPYPYAIGGAYPSDWLEVLKQFEDLHPQLIIPGHGKPQTDPGFLQNYRSLFEDIQEMIKSAKEKGLTEPQTVESIGRESAALAAKLGITDPNIEKEFKAYFLDIFVSRAFRESAAPLNDFPDGLPE